MSQLVFDSKPKLLQKLLDFSRFGYDRFTSGTVTPEKLDHLVKKMTLNYHVALDKHRRAYRKRTGLGNAVLVLYHHQTDDLVFWWLLVSPGDHPANVAERLQSTDELTVFGFKLTSETRRGKDQPVATWSMTSDAYQIWRNSIIDAVRSREVFRMVGVLAELYKLPGFSGIRRRIGQLATLYRSEVKRHGLSSIAPTTPARLGYVRRLRSTGKTVRQVAKRAAAKTHELP